MEKTEDKKTIRQALPNAVASVDIDRELKSTLSPYLVMVRMSPTGYNDGVLAAVASLTSERSGVYITINRPYSKLEPFFRQNNIDTSKIKFIDAITTVAVPGSKNTDGCFYVKSPSNLTEINIRLIEILRTVPGKKFLVIDSISTLLMYNKAEILVRFLHSLSTTLSAIGADAVLVAIEGEDSKELNEISSQFCDKTISV